MNLVKAQVLVARAGLPNKQSKRRLFIIGGIVGGAVGLVVLLIFVLMIITLTGNHSFGVPVPPNWQLVRESGRIPNLCAGGGSECGHIERVYRSSETKAAILATLHATAVQENCTMTDSGGGTADAVVRCPAGSATVFVDGKTITFDYTIN